MLQPTELMYNGTQFKKLYDNKINEIALQYGLTGNELHTLLFLANNPGYDTATAISDMRGISKSNVSRAVDSLIRQGFLKSREDEKDRRFSHLSILPAAEDLVRDAQIAQEQFLSCICNGFTREERHALDYLMGKICDNIQEALQQ